MKIFTYISKDYPYNGRIEQVLTDLEYAKFYFNQDILISIANLLNLTGFYIEDSVYKYLIDLPYILLFYNEKDKIAVNYARYAAVKSKNLIIVPNEALPFK